MDRKEFFEWLNTCPTHKWNITFEEHEFVTICFPVEDEEGNGGGFAFIEETV